jgi:hypothetical protein
MKRKAIMSLPFSGKHKLQLNAKITGNCEKCIKIYNSWFFY